MIVLTGGGTGGHLAEIKALKDALGELGHSPIFIGSTYGQGRQWFSNADGLSAAYFLKTRGVVNHKLGGKIVSLAMIAKATGTAVKILNRHRVKAVLSVGSYGSAPAAFAATLRRTPLFIHEHNTRISILHQLLLPFTKEFFSSYDQRSPISDYSVAEIFFDLRRRRSSIEHVIFLGGSQGARFINNFAVEMAPILSRKGIKISHQTGKREFERIKALYQTLNLNVDYFAFSRNMAQRMARADFAVTRAGAGTLWELAANGLPAFFVPYPYAARDHQYHNARFFTDQGLGFVAREPEINPAHLLAALECDAGHISDRLMRLIKPGGARKIAQRVLRLIGE